VIAFNLINYAAALTEISWWTFVWATGVGILPLTVLLAVAGDGMLQMPSWCWWRSRYWLRLLGPRRPSNPE
jgi:uncharacterized membrane protein YdjX (TVP38/TMEM64 family)